MCGVNQPGLRQQATAERVRMESRFVRAVDLLVQGLSARSVLLSDIRYEEPSKVPFLYFCVLRGDADEALLVYRPQSPYPDVSRLRVMIKTTQSALYSSSRLLNVHTVVVLDQVCW